MLRGESDAVAGSVVRVWSRAGEVVGAGFVAGPDTIATCAHVVAEALGTDAYASTPPAGAVSLDLPLLGAGSPPQVTAVVSRWLPIAADGTGDVALLRLQEPLPVGARMPPLRRADQLWDRSFRALGFPDGAWDGVWSSGVLRAGQGTGWVQLQGEAGGQPVVGGFSGSAVWDSAAGAVVGMTVAADSSGTTTAYLVPIDRVLGLDPELLPCPYQGLAPFTEDHAAFFFGRDADIERLVTAVGRQPIVALAGPSGAGKSSLLRAGLVPRLRRAGAQMVEVLPGASVADFVPDGTDQVLVLDQFEELAARDPRAAREQLEGVVGLTRSGSVRAVLTLRWSALDDLLTPALATVLEAGTLHVTPLDRANLRETIVRPAERAPGLDFEPGLVDRILDDAGSEPGQLPLVESLLADLWRRREGGRLTWRGYTEAGGVVGAVAQHAERVVAELAATSDTQFHERLRRLFGLLAAPDRGGRFVRVPMPTAALVPDLQAIVPRLAAGRLLVLGRDAYGAEIVELAHQALIDHWPRLRDWLAQDREFLAWRAQIDHQRDRWESAGRDDGALLRGTALAASADWLPARAAEVAPQIREYVARSTSRQRRDIRRWRIVTALLTVLALGAATLAVVAVQRGDRLALELSTANAEKLGREAIGRGQTDPLSAAQLALAAYRGDPRNALARNALAGSYLALQSTDRVIGDIGGAAGVVAGPGGAVLSGPKTHGRILFVGPDMQRWNVPDDTSDRLFDIGPDWVAAGDGAAGVRIWDRTTNALRRTVPIDGKPLNLVHFDDDRFAAIVDRGVSGYSLVLVDARTGATTPRPLPGVAPDLVRAVLLDDRTTLLEEFAGDPGAPVQRRAVRTLGADPAADTERPIPPDTDIIRQSGVVTLTCADKDGAQGTVTVTPVAGPIPARTVGTTTPCAGVQVSSEGEWLIEQTSVDPTRTQDVLRLTSLVDGRQYQALVPRARDDEPQKPLTVDHTLSAARGADGAVTVLSVRSPSLDLADERTAVLRVRAQPLPVGGAFHLRSSDGRWTVAPTAGQGITVTDSATGIAQAQLALDLQPDSTDVSVDDDVWVQRREPGGWTLRRYELPSLRLLVTYDLPQGDQPGDMISVGDADTGAGPGAPVVALFGGQLSAFDRNTGARIGGPVQVGGSDTARARLRDDPTLWARPGHPGQVLVNTQPDGLELWDAVAGRRLGALPVVASGSGGVAVDRAGKRIAVQSVDQRIEVYDLDTFQQVRAPLSIPEISTLIAFDADGYLVGGGNVALFNSFVLVDVDTGQVSGTLSPGTNVQRLSIGPDGITMTTGTMPGQAIQQVSLLSRDWFARVCAVVNRPFTDEERGVLPPGASTDPPCGR